MMNLYQEIIASMDRAQRVRFINTLRNAVAERLNLRMVSDVDLLANMQQDEYDEALEKTGLPLYTKQDGTLGVL
jgi:hypothetical protein